MCHLRFKFATSGFWSDVGGTQATLHRRYHDPKAIQMCTLMNIKTGGCSEDCSYCAQSSRYNTGLKATKISTVDSVLEAAHTAKKNGSTRFCMGAAWRDMNGRKTNFKRILEMVKEIKWVQSRLNLIGDGQLI